MKKFNFAFLLIFSLFLISCTGQKRGIDGATYVSTSKPSFSLSVPNLELRTQGRFNARITTTNALGGIGVDTWLAVYGGKSSAQPMAIIAQSSLKMPYYWDYDLTKSHSINHGKINLGGFTFQTCTYLIKDLYNDGFAPLTFNMEELENSNAEQGPVWIVRRFATRTDFEKGKITLEYREQAPTNFIDIKSLPYGAQAFLEEFEERAKNAFVFGESGTHEAQNIKTSYPQGIALRKLNKNFFGTISYYEPFD